MLTIYELADKWLLLDEDASTRAEIQQLVDSKDEPELESRLRRRITFGTAGLRSSMKAGFSHMNSFTVLQASHGLANYILQQNPQSPKVVLGYDARHNSERFARLAAAAFLSKGFQVLWFGKYVHTPMVPFSVSYYKASVGVMVTASHNPKNDNGYKVYWSNGCQIIPPHDSGIASVIGQVDRVDTWDITGIDDHENVEWIYDEATEYYHQALQDLIQPTTDTIPFTYTPMHGVGLPFMERTAHDMSIKMHIVQAQAQPDPEFTTVSFPNPEEKGALSSAIQTAELNGTSIIIANDPDADRFAVAERLKDTWHQFTGNEMGILLAHFAFESFTGDKSNLVMLASTVSSRMLAAMAVKEGFHFKETLTGFKWLGNVAQDLKEQGLDPIFAYEEAIGYMFPSVVWDKDGIAAAAVFLNAWQNWTRQGMTPYQWLQRLYSIYGYFADANTYLISPSAKITNNVFNNIRTMQNGKPPTQVGTRVIQRWRDLTLGWDTATLDGKPDLPVDATAQMITCELQDAVFTARGSGTEPKIKLYIEAKSTSYLLAKQIANEILIDLLREWFKSGYGLQQSS